jgi:tetratricopeptide (TPR) repeat protein
VKAEALHYLGETYENDGDTAGALARFEEALALRREISSPTEVAGTLVAIGRIHAEAGRAAEAASPLEEAVALGEEHDGPAELVLASCWLARTGGLPAETAKSRLEEFDARLNSEERMTAHHLLFLATGDPLHRTEAVRGLDHLLEHAPDADRRAMRDRVPLHRAIRRGEESIP